MGKKGRRRSGETQMAENVEKDIRRRMGRRLENYRRNVKLTQVEVAEQIGLPQPQISRYEKGEALVDLYILGSLAALYKVDVVKLLPYCLRKIDSSTLKKSTANFTEIESEVIKDRLRLSKIISEDY